jgi:23S rRNA (pseudouridine1915-N3)-methyltransferase
MKIVFLVIGKTSKLWIKEGIEVYLKRLKHYQDTTFCELPDVKGGGNMSSELLKEAEAKVYHKFITSSDLVVLLDEKGRQYGSRGFAKQLQKWRNSGPKRLVFVVGGAFGFASSVHSRANAVLSMSTMTTSHELIRIVFLEQLYRGMTILQGEQYHND